MDRLRTFFTRDLVRSRPDNRRSVVRLSRWMTGASLGLALLSCGPDGASPATSDTADMSAGVSSEASTTSTASTDSASSTTTVTTLSTGATATSTWDSTTSMSDATTDSCGFLACVDMGSDPNFPCNTYDQDCPTTEDGQLQKCLPVDGDDDGQIGDATMCVPVVGEGVHGDSCKVDPDDCQEGVMCWNGDLEATDGVCVAQCTGDEQDPTCEPQDSECFITQGNVFALCRDKCDPNNNECAGDQSCAHFDFPQPDKSGYYCI